MKLWIVGLGKLDEDQIRCLMKKSLNTTRTTQGYRVLGKPSSGI